MVNKTNYIKNIWTSIYVNYKIKNITRVKQTSRNRENSPKKGGRFLDTKLKQNKREFKTIQQYSGGKGDLDSTGAHRK